MVCSDEKIVETVKSILLVEGDRKVVSQGHHERLSSGHQGESKAEATCLSQRKVPYCCCWPGGIGLPDLKDSDVLLFWMSRKAYSLRPEDGPLVESVPKTVLLTGFVEPGRIEEHSGDSTCPMSQRDKHLTFRSNYGEGRSCTAGA